MRAIEVLIHKLFFRNSQVRPKSAWISRAKNLGHLEHGQISRNGGTLKYIIIQPIEQETQTIKETDNFVILSHPLSRKGKYFFTDSGRAKTYLDNGYSLLAFDYNGFGESDRIDLYYWRDAATFIEFVKNRFPEKLISLHGTSFGAFHIIRALKHLPKTASVVLENVNKSLFDYWKKWPVTALIVRFLEFFKVKAIQDMDVQEVFRHLNRDDLHIQFIACEDDEITTPEEMTELYSLLNSSNKSFTVIEGAKHLSAHTTNPTLYQSILLHRDCKSC